MSFGGKAEGLQCTCRLAATRGDGSIQRGEGGGTGLGVDILSILA